MFSFAKFLKNQYEKNIDKFEISKMFNALDFFL